MDLRLGGGAAPRRVGPESRNGLPYLAGPGWAGPGLLVPGLPAVELDPELVFLLFLPPLLYYEALFTSWRDFRFNLRPILLLAVGLVLMTTVVVAAVAHWVAGLPWGAAFVLGAIVSATDAVAATAIAERLGLPHRVVVVLSGESLVNDATVLAVLGVAVAAVVESVFSFGEAVFEFVVGGW